MVIVLAILGGGIVYEYVIKPNAVLAEVNGHQIRRKDYWKYQSVSLYTQARQYEAFGSQMQATQPQQAAQYLQFASSFDLQRGKVWGSTDVSDTTVREMIDDQLYVDGAESLGVNISDEEARLLALDAFSLPSAPLVTPLPTPTLIPARAEAATQTADAQATQQSIALGTPVGSPALATPLVSEGTPQATPVTGTSGTPISPLATPAAATPVTSAEATPSLEDSRTAAEANFGLFRDQVFGPAHMSMNDYIRLWALPKAVRERVDYQLTNTVPQSSDQVEAEHILVGTQDLANQLYEQVTGGADFEQIARSNSTDTGTAPTGGKLGWFTRLEMVPAFAEVAFGLQPGQISEPVQTQFGWHIIKVIDRNPDRPLSDQQYRLATDNAVSTWLEAQRNQSTISSDYKVTPTPTPSQFSPPADAPTPIPATPVPATPAPLIGPVPLPQATPVTDMLATPAATPLVVSPGAPDTRQSGAVSSTPLTSPVADTVAPTPDANANRPASPPP